MLPMTEKMYRKMRTTYNLYYVVEGHIVQALVDQYFIDLEKYNKAWNKFCKKYNVCIYEEPDPSKGESRPIKFSSNTFVSVSNWRKITRNISGTSIVTPYKKTPLEVEWSKQPPIPTFHKILQVLNFPFSFNYDLKSRRKILDKHEFCPYWANLYRNIYIKKYQVCEVSTTCWRDGCGINPITQWLYIIRLPYIPNYLQCFKEEFKNYITYKATDKNIKLVVHNKDWHPDPKQLTLITDTQLEIIQNSERLLDSLKRKAKEEAK